jgi:copper(I)-binding protein
MLDGAMSIDISRPWARTSPGIEGQAGGFFTVTNKGGEADLLVAAASPAAARIDIHGIRVVGSVITMRSMEKGLRVPPDTAITLKPRGYHLLLQDLTRPLSKGERVPVTLTFEKAGTRQIDLIVEAPGPINNETLMEDQPG